LKGEKAGLMMRRNHRRRGSRGYYEAAPISSEPQKTRKQHHIQQNTNEQNGRRREAKASPLRATRNRQIDVMPGQQVYLRCNSGRPRKGATKQRDMRCGRIVFRIQRIGGSPNQEGKKHGVEGMNEKPVSSTFVKTFWGTDEARTKSWWDGKGEEMCGSERRAWRVHDRCAGSAATTTAPERRKGAGVGNQGGTETEQGNSSQRGHRQASMKKRRRPSQYKNGGP